MTVSYPMTPSEFHARCFSLAMIYPYSVHGGGRTKKYNKEVGGKDDSWHIQWLAKDCILDDFRDGPALKKRAARMGLEVTLKSKGNFHIEPRG
ncbi:hypothetical protein LCGC14_0992120 [marine sediment metagenome]|uniref:Peptidase M15A C-terminal domain-containing protein n=1 Tax=marine sediment metagenome TaxID=412755 RepID=A0A0F9NS20_9ZZZZ